MRGPRTLGPDFAYAHPGYKLESWVPAFAGTPMSIGFR
jgi:hypothetical protein